VECNVWNIFFILGITQVGNNSMNPLILTIKGIMSYPQMYPCIPRYDIFEQYSVELGYQAIRLLTLDYITAVIKIFSLYAETIKSWLWFPALQKVIKAECDVTPSDKMYIHEWEEKILLGKCDLDRSKKKDMYIYFLRITSELFLRWQMGLDHAHGNISHCYRHRDGNWQILSDSIHPRQHFNINGLLYFENKWHHSIT